MFRNRFYLVFVLSIVVLKAFSQGRQFADHRNSYERTAKIYKDLQSEKNNCFKLLSYNVFNGFQGQDSVMKGFEEWIRKLDPDVIAFQEMNGFTAEKLKDFGERIGYAYTVLQKEEGHPLAFISKYPFQNVEVIQEGMWHGILYVKVNDYHLFNTHLDPKTYQARQEESKILMQHVKLLKKQEKVMIMGDFNNMSPQDRSFYDYNEEKMRLLRNTERNRPGITVLNNGQIDYKAVRNVLLGGFYDSFHLAKNIFDKTAPTRVRKHNNFTRIDYIFVNRALRRSVKQAAIVKDEFTDFMSDHYPVYIELECSK